MLSVVVPALNEEDNLATLAAEIVAALDGLVPFEIVFVDDGSDDRTPEVLRGLAREDARVRVLRHDRRAGQSAALRTGIRAARHAWIATLDGDGQNDPADLPVFWAARPGGDPAHLDWLAIGHRVDRRDRARKRLASRLANGIRSRLLRDQTPDTGCGVKLFPRALFLRLPWFDHAHRYLPALVQREGGTAVSIPVRHRPRRSGRSKYGVLDRALVGIFDLVGVMWLRRRALRVRADELDAHDGRDADELDAHDGRDPDAKVANAGATVADGDAAVADGGAAAADGGATPADADQAAADASRDIAPEVGSRR